MIDKITQLMDYVDAETLAIEPVPPVSADKIKEAAMARINNTHLKRSKTGKKLTRTVLIAAVVTTLLAATAAATVGIFSGINSIDDVSSDPPTYWYDGKANDYTEVEAAPLQPAPAQEETDVQFVSGGYILTDDGMIETVAPTVVVGSKTYEVLPDTIITGNMTEEGIKTTFTADDGEEVSTVGSLINLSANGQYTLTAEGELIVSRADSTDIMIEVDDNGIPVTDADGSMKCQGAELVIERDRIFTATENSDEFIAPDGSTVTGEEMRQRCPDYYIYKEGAIILVHYFEPGDIVGMLDRSEPITTTVDLSLVFYTEIPLTSDFFITKIGLHSEDRSKLENLDGMKRQPIFIGGLPGSTEAMAYEEYVAFTRNTPNYTEEQKQEKIQEICSKYGLISWDGSNMMAYYSLSELTAICELDNFITEGTFNDIRGYASDSGYVNIEMMRLTLSDGYTISLDLRRTPKGMFTDISSSVYSPDWYEDWDYQTQDGTIVHISLSGINTYMFADLDGAFVYINIGNGKCEQLRWTEDTGYYMQPAITRQQLEMLAESIDWENLS